MANINKQDLNKLLTIISGVHPSSYHQLYTNETSFGFSSTFNKVRGSVSADEIVKSISRNHRLSDFEIEGYQRDNNIILRFYKSEEDKNNAKGIPQVPLSNLRTYYRKKITNIVQIPRYDYTTSDAYPSKNDWVIVFYGAEKWLPIVKQNISNSEYNTTSEVYTNNGNVYVKILNVGINPDKINVSSRYSDGIKSDKVEPINQTFDSVKFVNDVLLEVANKSLSIDDLSNCLTWCAELTKKETIDIELLSKLAKLVGKQLSIKLI